MEHFGIELLDLTSYHGLEIHYRKNAPRGSVFLARRNFPRAYVIVTQVGTADSHTIPNGFVSEIVGEILELIGVRLKIVEEFVGRVLAVVPSVDVALPANTFPGGYFFVLHSVFHEKIRPPVGGGLSI